VSLLHPDLHSFGLMPRRGITGSFDIFIFSFSRNLQMAFHNVCTSLHSYQLCIGFLFHHSLTNISCYFPWLWPL
jgi:hypothetical protein